MPSTLLRLRPALEPAIAVGFVGFWLAADSTRHTSEPAWLVLVVAFGAAIALARRWAWVSFALLCAIPLAQALHVLPLPDSTSWALYLGLAITAALLASHDEARLRWVTLAAGVPVIALSAALTVLGGWESWTGSMFFFSPYGGVGTVATLIVIGWSFYLSGWLLGLVLRLATRNLRARALLDETASRAETSAAELTATRERERIAQEVHDVLAHSLAVVIAQSDGARLDAVPGRSAADTEAFVAIAAAARSALVDVRGLVESLRDDTETGPAPTMGELPALVDQLERTGLDVRLATFGTVRHVTPARQLAVYRIVQESLTNALRHGERSHGARVVLDWRGEGLAVSVQSRRSEHDTDAIGHGNGIPGMSERARLAGGWLSAGPVDDDGPGFLVSAFIPTDPPAPDDSRAEPPQEPPGSADLRPTPALESSVARG